ncbi:hypothetical protein ACZ90_47435 [Streptomyces albus subsp. albus]|nr:hypothetical protein ACZ90_47435 [Streptomyces albus subsp. albus]
MTESRGAAQTCLACDLTTGQVPLSGGTLARTAHWVVEHCVGPLGLGALVVKPVRHVVHLAELTAEEAGELGPLLRRTSAAISSVVRPEQVYACLWSHAGGVPGHIHFVVQPARREDLDRHGTHGPALQAAMFAEGEQPSEVEVERVCERLRVALG